MSHHAFVPETTSPTDLAGHWDAALVSRGLEGVSWYQPEPHVSLELIGALDVHPAAAVLDVGGGVSFLVDRLLERGFADLTVLDFSKRALDELRARLPAGVPVTLLQENLLEWRPQRRYALWHDRALLHFLVAAEDRQRYADRLRTATAPGAAIVIGVFSPDAPPACSGLPVLRYTADELALVLGEGFELLEARREEHVTPRGAVQPFTWIAGRRRAS